MKTTNPLPLTVFSQNDYKVELENMFDTQTNQQFTIISSDSGKLTYTSPFTIAIGNNLLVSFVKIEDGELTITETEVEVTSTPSAGEFNIEILVGAFPSSQKCSYYKSDATTPKDVTIGLQPSGGTTTNFRIRANSEGKGSVYIGEILRQYLPEFLAPKDYELDEITLYTVDVDILFNGVANTIMAYKGSKYLGNPLEFLPLGKNPLNQDIKFFKEQLIGYLLNLGDGVNSKVTTFDYEAGVNTFEGSEPITFNLYPSIPCRKPIYLSANYGLLPDGELIDVSVPVLAFVNRAGQYEYIRFSGSNVNKYNVQEARLKQAFDSTLTNADTGLIYEGIELTLANDETEQPFAYTIDKLEYQRCNALLMESPKAWLLVNGDLQQCLEVRVKRESVRFLSSFDKNRDNYTATCEVIICQPLGNPQY
jgi:hypothetical protein